ncbi:hypothetical protein FIM12_08095 [SAR202 cluster bacterium AD-804-J14_MRT_500m]|nr:hypothetical protein [SAR202 cluster bacterium AD-804-J14_MRT_500m]
MDAISATQIVKAPKQHLHTFGVTKLNYYVVTEPVYKDLLQGPSESVVREGTVTAQRPAVVTPTYMAHLNGFGEDAHQYFGELARNYGPNSPGILYRYTNEPGEMNIVEGTVGAVAERISERLSDGGNNLSAVIRGVDELWDVSLMKFIFEYTVASIGGNIQELQRERLMHASPDSGIPQAAVDRINALFSEVKAGGNHSDLKRELDRWGIFDKYKDRFLDLFKK